MQKNNKMEGYMFLCCPHFIVSEGKKAPTAKALQQNETHYVDTDLDSEVCVRRERDGLWGKSAQSLKVKWINNAFKMKEWITKGNEVHAHQSERAESVKQAN